MKKFFTLLFLSISACSVNTSEKVAIDELKFSYSDDAYIFFRNMRQTNYDLEVMEEGGWRIYRHEDRQTDTTGFFFNVSLVVNWRVNKVYPIIEMNQSVKTKKFRVHWQSIESNEEGTIALKGLKRTDEMVFVTQLYNKMTEEVEMFAQYEGEKLPLFGNTNQKEAFRVSLYDFYRMTGLL